MQETTRLLRHRLVPAASPNCHQQQQQQQQQQVDRRLPHKLHRLLASLLPSNLQQQQQATGWLLTLLLQSPLVLQQCLQQPV
jgi:hypothetical protein